MPAEAQGLGDDVVGLIAVHLDARSLCRLSCAHPFFQEMPADVLWKRLFEQSRFRLRAPGWACANGAGSIEGRGSDCEEFDQQQGEGGWKRAFSTLFASSPCGAGDAVEVGSAQELQDAARRAAGDGAVEVWLRAGRYDVGAPLQVRGRLVVRGGWGGGPAPGRPVELRGNNQPLFQVFAGGSLIMCGVSVLPHAEGEAGGQDPEERVRVSSGASASLVCCDVRSSGKGAVVEAGGGLYLQACDFTCGGSCVQGTVRARDCIFQGANGGSLSPHVEGDGPQHAQGDAAAPSLGADVGPGVVELRGRDCRIDNCIVLGTPAGAGIRIAPGAGGVVVSCLIRGGRCGISAIGRREGAGDRGECGDADSAFGILVQGCRILGNLAAGLHVRGSAVLWVEECEVTDNGAGVVTEKWLRPIKFQRSRLRCKSGRGMVALEGCEISGNAGAGIEAMSRDNRVYSWCSGGNMRGLRAIAAAAGQTV